MSNLGTLTKRYPSAGVPGVPNASAETGVVGDGVLREKTFEYVQALRVFLREVEGQGATP